MAPRTFAVLSVTPTRDGNFQVRFRDHGVERTVKTALELRIGQAFRLDHSDQVVPPASDAKS